MVEGWPPRAYRCMVAWLPPREVRLVVSGSWSAPQFLGVLGMNRADAALRRVQQLNRGMIGFDVGSCFRGSGSRMQSQLDNDLCKPIGADSKRTEFALAA